MVGIQNLADSFSSSLEGQGRLLEPDVFSNFMLNLSSTIMADAASIGSSEDVFKNANNLASVVNSPSGSAGMSYEKLQKFIGGLVTSMNEAAATMEKTEETVELMMGSMSSVANGQSERLSSTAQATLFWNTLTLLKTAASPGSRIAISDSSSSSACNTLATLLGSDVLFGTGNINYSSALSDAWSSMASGKLVGRFPGMSSTETRCNGVLVSAQKFSAKDTDGVSILAGNSSFTMPGNFSRMANLSIGDIIETSAQVPLYFVLWNKFDF
jgi:hypothetical protein